MAWLVTSVASAVASRARALHRPPMPLRVRVDLRGRLSETVRSVPTSCSCETHNAEIIPFVFLANVSARAWRLLCGSGLEPMLIPALAHSPSEFWRRWNRPAQQFFQEHAFRVSGGRDCPFRGILIAFFASGIVHEYVFGITTGRLRSKRIFVQARLWLGSGTHTASRGVHFLVVSPMNIDCALLKEGALTSRCNVKLSQWLPVFLR